MSWAERRLVARNSDEMEIGFSLSSVEIGYSFRVGGPLEIPAVATRGSNCRGSARARVGRQADLAGRTPLAVWSLSHPAICKRTRNRLPPALPPNEQLSPSSRWLAFSSSFSPSAVACRIPLCSSWASWAGPRPGVLHCAGCCRDISPRRAPRGRQFLIFISCGHFFCDPPAPSLCLPSAASPSSASLPTLSARRSLSESCCCARTNVSRRLSCSGDLRQLSVLRCSLSAPARLSFPFAPLSRGTPSDWRLNCFLPAPFATLKGASSSVY